MDGFITVYNTQGPSKYSKVCIYGFHGLFNFCLNPQVEVAYPSSKSSKERRFKIYIRITHLHSQQIAGQQLEGNQIPSRT